MNEVLKQRLVGALILLALGVIFWPIIFVQPEHEEISPHRSMPAQPGVATQGLEPPGQGELRASPDIAAQAESLREIAPVPAPQPTPAPGAAAGEKTKPKSSSKPAVQPAPRKEKPEPLQLDDDGVPVAWILQVASVSSAEKAKDLRQRLLALQHEAYVEQVSSNGRALHRVYVGPKFEKAELDAKRAIIDAEFGVTSMIRRYVP